MSRITLGIDVGASAVRTVALRSGRRGTTVVGYADAAVEADGILAALQAALTQLGEGVELAGAEGVLGWRADRFAFRQLWLPFDNPKKVRQVLPFELEAHLPFPAEGLAVDFTALGGNGTGTGVHRPFLAAATVEQEMQPLVAVLSEFQIEPGAITVGGMALPPAASSRQAEEADHQVVVVLDGHTTLLLASISGSLETVRCLPSGYAGAAGGRRLGREIRTTVNAFNLGRTSAFSPDQISVTGDGAGDAECIGGLGEALDLPVVRLDLAASRRIDFEGNLQHRWVPHRMDSALSLGLVPSSGFAVMNFRRGTLAPQPSWQEQRRRLVLPVVLALAVVGLWLTLTLQTAAHLRSEADRLDARIKAVFRQTLPEVKHVRHPVVQMREAYEKAQQELRLPEDTGRFMRTVDILAELSRLLPASLDVQLTKVTVGPGTVSISGNTDGFNTVDRVKTQLQQSRRFKETTITSSRKNKSGSRIAFKMQIDY
jgi:general secretion pathway protein L